jgi:hypothetical protein
MERIWSSQMVEFDPRMTSAEAQIALVQNWTACLEISRASVPSSFNIFLQVFVFSFPGKPCYFMSSYDPVLFTVLKCTSILPMSQQYAVDLVFAHIFCLRGDGSIVGHAIRLHSDTTFLQL